MVGIAALSWVMTLLRRLWDMLEDWREERAMADLPVIFSAFASTPPAIADDTLAAATIVWNYVGEILFNMLVLVGCIKMSDRLIRELMGLG